jgi:adenine-specific DNA-methyltransferase
MNVGCEIYSSPVEGDEGGDLVAAIIIEMVATSVSAPPLDTLRVAIKPSLDLALRSEYGQFMTSPIVAHFMASQFSPVTKPVRLLDAGAGFGALTTAFIGRFGALNVTVDAWEIDPYIQSQLAKTLSNCVAHIHSSDFINDAVWNVMMQTGTRFTHAILNPPYRKINSDSKHRLQLRKVGIETVNLYTAFMALAIKLMEDGGEIVAIIPRSFCNGVYYHPFREFLLHHCAIKRIHVFESRANVFKADDVLQENIIIKLEAGKPQGAVVISDSYDSNFDDYRERELPFENIVKQNDAQHYIHIPLRNDHPGARFFGHTLNEIGIEVSTGPVVDFRVRHYCLSDLVDGAAPLLYPHHFRGGHLTYPKQGKKPNAILVNDETRKAMMPAGHYVLVKRFTTKEEKRRVVAYTLDPDMLTAPHYAFENHLNVFHVDKRGLDAETAHGLALYLNSKMVDETFRSFSGHTQVNATDLTQLRYPSREQLRRLGAMCAGKHLDQNEIDLMLGLLERSYAN